MKISFVIPAYNEEERVGHCVESVQKEIVRSGLEKDVEVIVVNNASTDRTREIASRFSGVQVVDESHKGLTFARQAGYTVSSGELIANVDADTIVPPGWLDTVIQEFNADPKLVALSGPFIYYDLSFFRRALASAFTSIYPAVHFLFHRVLGYGAILQGGNFVLRRSALEKAGGFDTSIDFYGEDTDIARRISRFGTVKWTLRFPIYSSGRRLKEEGMFTTGLRYSLNFFSTTFTGKPYTKSHTDIRSPYEV